MPRVFYPAFRGIIIRGIERRKIFRDNKDRDNLVERLEHLIPATKEWGLLLTQLFECDRKKYVQTSENSVRQRMVPCYEPRQKGGGYLQRENRAHASDGHLFRGRYKSILVDADIYLLELVRYIHRNLLQTG